MTALRSGEFRQGREYLNNSRGMCCLGVMCEIAHRQGVPVRRAVRFDPKTVAYDGSAHYPPAVVLDWAGLDSTPMSDVHVRLDADVETPKDGGRPIYRAGEVVGLGVLNDGGADFDTIAGIIDRCM